MNTSMTSLIPRHIPTLDYLRGAAILMVMLFHSYGGVTWTHALGTFFGGIAASAVGELNYGVQLFFLLSGFLITSILIRGRDKPSYYSTFYIKRALRILPVLVVILITIKLYLPVSWGFFVASCLFLSNFAPLFGARSGEYGPLWSLCVEEHFYLLWPTIVRRCGFKFLTGLLLFFIVGEPALRVLAINHNAHTDIRFKTPFLLDYLAYGALLPILIHRGKLHAGNIRKVGRTLVSIGTLLVLATLYLTAFHDNVTLIALRAVPWMWLCTGVLLLGLRKDALHASVPANAEKTPGVLGFFAWISYGLYLIHPIVNIKLGRHVAAFLTGHGYTNIALATGEFLVCGAVAVGIAFLSRQFFEGSFDKLKKRLLEPKAPTALIPPQAEEILVVAGSR